MSHLILRWSDNGTGIFSNELHLEERDVGDELSTRVIPRMGNFKTRQYQFVYSGDKLFTLAGVEEEASV